MVQTVQGAHLAAARRQGISLDEYEAHLSAGESWCTRCKAWHLATEFGRDASRPSGQDASCRASRRAQYDRTYVPVPLDQRKPMGPTGGRMSDEARAKVSVAKKGKPAPWRRVPHTLETRAKISAVTRQRALRGPDSPRYKDGKVAERRGVRFSLDYKRWRYDVMTRDYFACQHCGDDQGGNLVAHHIKGFAKYPDLRLVIDNGLTLCKRCHLAHHREHGYG